MLDCCINPQNLGCFSACSEYIDTKIVSSVEQEYTFLIKFRNINIRKKQLIKAGETIKFKNNLNEDFEYMMNIFNADDTIFGSPCYKFKINNELCY